MRLASDLASTGANFGIVGIIVIGLIGLGVLARALLRRRGGGGPPD